MDKEKFKFCLIEIGWLDGGPFIDFCCLGGGEEASSLVCLNFSFLGFYLEILGFILIDTFEG